MVDREAVFGEVGVPGVAGFGIEADLVAGLAGERAAAARRVLMEWNSFQPWWMPRAMTISATVMATKL